MYRVKYSLLFNLLKYVDFLISTFYIPEVNSMWKGKLSLKVNGGHKKNKLLMFRSYGSKIVSQAEIEHLSSETPFLRNFNITLSNRKGCCCTSVVSQTLPCLPHFRFGGVNKLPTELLPEFH